ncbi:MAG: integrase [Alphaproteobacteria bacterium]|nr:MAG: integrase [Alphaproteobacteria bacterium]PZO39884.1 MAG: integrase [Alphaproteobacteria bacterium]
MGQLQLLSSAFVASTKEVKLHSDGGNLFLRVTSRLTKSWSFIFNWRGRRREMGLGPYPAVSLATARKLATEARALLATGANPIDARREANRSVPTFGDFADDYVNTHEAGWSNAKHVSQWRYSVEIDAAKLRKIPVDQITVEDVLGVLKPIWLVKPETARRCQGRIARILAAAKARGFRSGENPAGWKENLDQLLPKQPKLISGHHPAMNPSDVAGFMKRLQGLPGTSANALIFTILTAARTSETLEARWSEIDFVRRVWVIPAERMKMKKPHRVPLSEAAIGLLEKVLHERGASKESVRSKDAFIFTRGPADRPLSNMAMAMLLRREKVTGVSVHGFRSTFRTWFGEQTTFPRELAELSLAHLVGTDVERAYSRGDALERRREVMSLWAEFCSAKAAGQVLASAA